MKRGARLLTPLEEHEMLIAYLLLVCSRRYVLPLTDELWEMVIPKAP